MNGTHLAAILWLRWRILVNRMRRASKGSNLLLVLILGVVACVSVGLFFVGLFAGLSQLPGATPVGLLITWTVLASIFLFLWVGGLVTELQQSDSMSLKALWHLPIALHWVFLYNYLGTFVAISVVLFLPAMLGLSLAMVFVFGPSMLVVFPLVLAFFVMVTGLTYQLRGWLARLMEDKRRGRNTMAVVTMGFVLVAQAPNLLSMSFNRSTQELHELEMEARTLRLTNSASLDEVELRLAELQEARVQLEVRIENWMLLGTAIVPLGWLPFGVRAAADGQLIFSGLSLLGMLAIGGWSLRRSYRKTLAGLLGQTSGGAVALVSTGKEASDAVPRTLLVERELPFTGTRVAGVALAHLRGVLRAPEFKMTILRTIMMLGVFAFVVPLRSVAKNASYGGPLMTLGAAIMALLSLDHMMLNQFGFDRDGFRAYVLSPVPRREILLAKNLAMGSLAFLAAMVALLTLQVYVRLDAEHFLGAVCQLLSALFLQCLAGNLLSILSPIRVASDGLKPTGSKWIFALRSLFVTLLLLVCYAPLLLPLGAELLFQDEAWARGLPLYGGLHALGAIVCFGLYRWAIRGQGRLLQASELRMLATLGE